jgi:hypothetical protein
VWWCCDAAQGVCGHSTTLVTLAWDVISCLCITSPATSLLMVVKRLATRTRCLHTTAQLSSDQATPSPNTPHTLNTPHPHALAHVPLPQMRSGTLTHVRAQRPRPCHVSQAADCEQSPTHTLHRTLRHLAQQPRIHTSSPWLHKDTAVHCSHTSTARHRAPRAAAALPLLLLLVPSAGTLCCPCTRARSVALLGCRRPG